MSRNFEVYRLMYEHYRNKTVIAMNRADFESYLSEGDTSGGTLYLADVPPGLKQFQHEASVLGVEFAPPSEMPEQMVIVRYDSNNRPARYKRYRYMVEVDLDVSTSYPSVVQKAGLTDSPDLRSELRDYVFFVGQFKGSDHWNTALATTLARLHSEQQCNDQEE